MLEKTEISGLCKDTETNAVINTDNASLKAYKAKKMQLKKVSSMENRIQNLENELLELKNFVFKNTQMPITKTVMNYQK